ncbi:Hsp20/alpha crystallin family protein [Streptomyces axinellae]|jgi:HSP20 family protein|uniref:Hsp20/alpha crystallin family protein n=1 Tax=Streptomyces axinellae TaxID=552788 RepID=A0ABN3QTZ7_9ACTN
MLMRTDPFRELDLFAQRLAAAGNPGTWSKPAAMPMDAYREGDTYVLALDLPGVDKEAIEVTVERNMLTVSAERRPLPRGENVQTELSERPLGVFRRRVMLTDTLDAERLRADYEAGVLVLRIPIAERAKPRRIAIGGMTERARDAATAAPDEQGARNAQDTRGVEDVRIERDAPPQSKQLSG